MSNNYYSNFVRPSSPEREVETIISGEDAKRIYLEEIKGAGIPRNHVRQVHAEYRHRKAEKPVLENVSTKDLFISAQNNDVDTLKLMLDACPNMLNIIDDYGWSLLMIACQANSVDAVRELMKRRIDTSVRDKAGNSARSLVIKNKNLVLVDIFLSYRSTESKIQKNTDNSLKRQESKFSKRNSEEYFCEICNKEFPDKEEHLSSTVHNIDASKGKKIPSSYVIPMSNKGYQLMLKGGWDRESGLGPDGSGKKYPIQTVQKRDRKGLGLDKRKRKIEEDSKDSVKHVNRKLLEKECRSNRSMEINFRREFY